MAEATAPVLQGRRSCVARRAGKDSRGRAGARLVGADPYRRNAASTGTPGDPGSHAQSEARPILDCLLVMARRGDQRARPISPRSRCSHERTQADLATPRGPAAARRPAPRRPRRPQDTAAADRRAREQFPVVGRISALALWNPGTWHPALTPGTPGTSGTSGTQVL